MPAREPTTVVHNDWDGTSTPTEAEQWRGAEINDRTEVMKDHAARHNELIAYTRDFGDAFQTTYTMIHGKENVSSVTIIDNTTKKPVGVGVDWLTTPGQVVVGPFATAPAVNQMRVIVEGYKL